MFITLDAAAGVPAGRQKSTADRACDQCKYVNKIPCAGQYADDNLHKTGCARFDVTWPILAKRVLVGT